MGFLLLLLIICAITGFAYVPMWILGVVLLLCMVCRR